MAIGRVWLNVALVPLAQPGRILVTMAAVRSAKGASGELPTAINYLIGDNKMPQIL